MTNTQDYIAAFKHEIVTIFNSKLIKKMSNIENKTILHVYDRNHSLFSCIIVFTDKTFIILNEYDGEIDVNSYIEDWEINTHEIFTDTSIEQFAREIIGEDFDMYKNEYLTNIVPLKEKQRLANKEKADRETFDRLKKEYGW